MDAAFLASELEDVLISWRWPGRRSARRVVALGHLGFGCEPHGMVELEGVESRQRLAHEHEESFLCARCALSKLVADESSPSMARFLVSSIVHTVQQSAAPSRYAPRARLMKGIVKRNSQPLHSRPREHTSLAATLLLLWLVRSRKFERHIRQQLTANRIAEFGGSVMCSRAFASARQQSLVACVLQELAARTELVPSLHCACSTTAAQFSVQISRADLLLPLAADNDRMACLAAPFLHFDLRRIETWQNKLRPAAMALHRLLREARTSTSAAGTIEIFLGAGAPSRRDEERGEEGVELRAVDVEHLSEIDSQLLRDGAMWATEERVELDSLLRCCSGERAARSLAQAYDPNKNGTASRVQRVVHVATRIVRAARTLGLLDQLDQSRTQNDASTASNPRSIGSTFRSGSTAAAIIDGAEPDDDTEWDDVQWTAV